MLKLILRGALAGLALTALVAVGDSVVYRGYLFGLLTVMIGAAAGGMLLLIALTMSLMSYFLASRGAAIALRRRLLLAAIWIGAAGLTCGFASVSLWIVAGRPIFP